MRVGPDEDQVWLTTVWANHSRACCLRCTSRVEGQVNLWVCSANKTVPSPTPLTGLHLTPPRARPGLSPAASASPEGQIPPTSVNCWSFTTMITDKQMQTCHYFLSSCICRSPEEVDMDELMAAMVLSSLSCSPPLQGPAHPDAAGTQQWNKPFKWTLSAAHHAILYMYLCVKMLN